MTETEIKKFATDEFGDTVPEVLAEEGAWTELAVLLAERLRDARVQLDVSQAEDSSFEQQLSQAETAIDELRTENMCDACAGSGEPVSGKPCMCKGTGKMSVAALTIREALAKALTKLDSVRFPEVKRGPYSPDHDPSFERMARAFIEMKDRAERAELLLRKSRDNLLDSASGIRAEIERSLPGCRRCGKTGTHREHGTDWCLHCGQSYSEL